ncbi:MAG TPA: hypothetical protein VHM93_21635 [Candidatus Acidoferrum sp.]|nr:hypothetical protein [Candidatus Acidoferrum sp.]
MATSAPTTTRPERPASSPYSKDSAEEVFRRTRVRELALARLLMAYVTTGLVFMLFPGTLLGVWNLLEISGRGSAGLVSPARLEAHGHAQVFGWIGSFLLGIGLYSIPKLRGEARQAIRAAWVCWALWTIGVALRWSATVYLWEWRLLLPLSGVLELAAFLIFFRIISEHRPRNRAKQGFEPWVWAVLTATIGFLAVVGMNLVGSFYVSLRGDSPAFPHRFDQRYLALMGWGFLVPFVWGFSAKWLGVFLGLKALRTRVLASALAVNSSGVVMAITGQLRPATWAFVLGTALAIVAIRVFEPGELPAKTKGVHVSFPVFVRVAYVWLLVAALLGVGASIWDTSGGMWGASRHALTVGFISVMVLSIGPRILPAFAGMRLLWSTKLMFAALLLVSVGCTLRVFSEVLAYQGYAAWAWSVLPGSALLELAGLTAFAVNILGTFLLEPSHVSNQPVIMGIPEMLARGNPPLK